MIAGILIAVASVAAGAALALRAGGQGIRHLVPVRSFALAAVAVVVLLDLLPESLREIGPEGILAFLGGLAAPSIAGGLAARLTRNQSTRDHICMEVSYAGLLVHQFGDGLALGAAAGGHAGRVHHDLVIAIAAHTIPVAALVVVAYQAHLGRGQAVLRAAGLAGAAVAGVLLTSAAAGAWLALAGPWGAAVVAGMLLHVLAHDAGGSVPRDRGTRVAEVLAVLAGLALPVLSGQGGPHAVQGIEGAAVARSQVLDALGGLVLQTSPTLLLGFVVSAALQAFGGGIPARWFTVGSDLRLALRGAGVGAPLPVCSCGVLPLAAGLLRKKAAPAFVIAFLFATPELGVETVALTVTFLGWPFAALRVLTALLVAIVAAVVVARVVRGTGPPSAVGAGAGVAGAPGASDGHRHEEEALGGEAALGPAAGVASRADRFVVALEELVRHVGPWTVLGLIGAAYVEAMVSPESLAASGATGLDIFVVSLVAVPAYVCAGAATPLAATLLAKGLSPGAVLAGLLLGPATNLATLAFLRSAYGVRAAATGLLALVAAVWAAAACLNLTGFAAPVAEAVHGPEEAGVLGVAASVGMALLVLWSLWRGGVRTWLLELGVRPGHVH